jgi:hypothetical protein
VFFTQHKNRARKKEYSYLFTMVLSKGSKVVISHLPGEDDESKTITAALDEDLVLGISSSFSQLIEDNENKTLTVLGGALKTVSGGALGGSGQIKQAGFQIWNKTEPITISLTLGFYRKTNAAKDIAGSVRTLLKLPLPGEKAGGLLVPPGPSVIEALGIEPQAKGVDSYVNLDIGGVSIPRCIMTQADPTYSKYQDSSDYPVYVRVQCTFRTMYSGTKAMVDTL